MEHVASLGFCQLPNALGAQILVWDVINNLRNDWRLVSSSKQGFPTSVYFTTRYFLGTSEAISELTDALVGYRY